MSLVTYGDTGVVDIKGSPIEIGAEAIMWRPHSLDKIVIIKYNPKTKQMGVETKPHKVFGLKRFSTPFAPEKFYIL